MRREDHIMKKKMKFTLMLAAAVVVVMAFTMMPQDASAATYNYSYTFTCNNGSTVDIDTNLNLLTRYRAGDAKELKFKISTTDGSTFGSYSHLKTPQNELTLNTYNKTSFEDSVYLDAIGEYSFDISGGKNDDYRFSLPEVFASAPSKIRVYSTPTKVYFNKKYVSAATCGTDVWIKKNGETNYYEMNTASGDIVSLSGFKPNKKYKFEIRSGIVKGDTLKYTSPVVTKTVPTGPSVKPVIKSVKVYNVKFTPHYDLLGNIISWTSKYSIKVTLSKKASKTKGIVMTLGNGEQRKIKGTGKTFKAGFNSTMPNSQKNTKMTVKVMTYSDNTYMCYSYDSKAKKITIK